jgi:hypothetical protein
MTNVLEQVKTWALQLFYRKRDFISVSRGAADAGRPIIVGSDGKLDASMVQIIGTWTPTLTLGGGSTGIAYTTRIGRYVRIGDLVMATCWIVLSSKGSSTGAVAITGLPIASVNASDTYHTMPAYFNGLTGASGAMMPYIAPNGTSILIEYLGTGMVTSLTDTNLTATSSIMLTATYLAA